MKRISRCVSFMSAAALIATAGFLVSCGTTTKNQKAIELFNGHDLNGWQHVLADASVPREKVWQVENGILKCSGDPIGALYRGPEVTNFRMVVEYRWPGKPGNSGVFSRIEEPVRPLPKTVEVQLKHGDAGHVLGLQGKAIAPGQPRSMKPISHPLAGEISGVTRILDAEKPPGEWNRVEVLAQGDKYTVWMNGKLVNEASGVSTGRGKVGIQSEGGEIHFRKVQLTPLDN